MARRTTYNPPPSANLTVKQMQDALPRLDLRLKDLRAFDPGTIARRDDPEIKTLENAIDDFLIKTFGQGTVEYKRYSSAKQLDTAGISFGHPTPFREIIEGLQHGKNRAIEVLEGIKKIFLEEIELETPSPIAYATQDVEPGRNSREIFVVHGTDHGTRDTVARFLQKLDLSPIILDEEANKGRTVHQKFRDHSTVGYAVVLFTPDDRGGPNDGSHTLKPRARQNVVYELGFFSAKLGDSRVCVLYADEVEIPSDLSGVLYVPIDDRGGWQFRLAKEIKAAGIQIDMNKV